MVEIITTDVAPPTEMYVEKRLARVAFPRQSMIYALSTDSAPDNRFNLAHSVNCSTAFVPSSGRGETGSVVAEATPRNAKPAAAGLAPAERRLTAKNRNPLPLPATTELAPRGAMTGG
jgi:hypothetical protein